MAIRLAAAPRPTPPRARMFVFVRKLAPTTQHRVARVLAQKKEFGRAGPEVLHCHPLNLDPCVVHAGLGDGVAWEQ